MTHDEKAQAMFKRKINPSNDSSCGGQVFHSSRDKQNYGEQDIAKTALPKFIEKLEVCRDLFYGFDYSGFMSEIATDLVRAKAISGGVNFLTAIDAPPRSAMVRDGGYQPDSMAAEPSVGYGDATSRCH
jgi:type I restriction enzyme R subunit